MTLKGKLENFGLGELLQTLALNRHTGTLMLEREAEHKKIYFSTGTITLLSTGQSVRIGEILRREGCVSEAQLEQAAEEQKVSGKLFGQILVEKEYVALEDIQRALRKKVEEEIYDLFLWPDGEFEFLSDYCPAELMDPLQRFTQLKIDPSALIMEGLRQLDEFKVIRQLIPDSRMILQRVVEEPDAELTNDADDVWRLTEKSGPASEILDNSPLTRFYTMECLYQLIKAGWLRGLDYHEHLAVARDERKLGNTEDAAKLYQFLVETQPRAQADREFLKESGFFLADMRNPEVAVAPLTKALEAYLRSGEHSIAWTIGLRLIELERPSLDLLRSLWPAHVAGSKSTVNDVFTVFTKELLAQNENDELEVILEEGLEACGEDASYWVLRGDNARAMNNPRVAAEWYERALDFLREGRDDTEIIRLLRGIYDLDPDREDIAERLKQTLGRREMREATRRRRHFIAACFALVLVVAFAYATTYEVNARRLFDDTNSLALAYELDKGSLSQEQKKTPGDRLRHFEGHQADAAERIRLAYQELIDGYSMSSRVDMARDAIHDLNSWEAGLRANVERIKRSRDEAERELRDNLQDRLRELRQEEQSAIASVDYTKLREVRTKLLEECGPLVDASSIFFPLLIDTNPRGAVVEIDGSAAGSTPFLHEYKPEAEFTIAIQRRGCEPKTVNFKDNGQTILRIELERKALTKTYFPPIGGSVLSDGETFFVSSRDGWLYATPNSKVIGQEARWRLRVGVPGHPAAKLSVIGSDLMVGSFDGTIQRVALSGQTVWSQGIDEPLLSATISPSEAWIVVGDERGSIYLLDSSTGNIENSVKTGFPIEAVHVGERVRIATRRNQLVTFSIPDLRQVGVEDLTSPVLGFMPNGEPLFDDGRVGSNDSLPKPNSEILNRDGVLSYVSDSRQLVLVDRQSTTIFDIPREMATPPIRVEDNVYATDSENNLCAFSASGQLQWSVAIGGECEDVRVGFDGNLIVFLETGGIIVVEGNAP